MLFRSAGVLGPQNSSGRRLSQIEQVHELIGNREVDIVVLSVGGNDVGFTSILSTCALFVDCPLQKGVTSPLDKYASVQTGVQALTAELPNAYARIANCLGARACRSANGAPMKALKLSNEGRVLPMTYPDITRAANGAPCRYLTLGASDFAWARDTILVPQAVNPYPYTTYRGKTENLSTTQGTLNGHIVGTSSLGWTPVVGIWGSSGESTTGHGVCAGQDAWVFGITGITGPFAGASFHPNPAGQNAMGAQIARVLGVS